MTTIREIDVRCAVCGVLARMAELGSTSAFGPPDLDLRPNGPARWALEYRVQRCGSCGYCAGSIGQAPVGAEAVVRSEGYRDVLLRGELPRLARSLFCAGLVEEAAARPESAAWRFLEAAWACDDRRRPAGARVCRERAAEMFARALAEGEARAPDAQVHTLVADVLRRARRFEEALASCERAERELAELAADEDDDELGGVTAVVAFVRRLAEQRDDGPRSVAEAFAPDADD